MVCLSCGSGEIVEDDNQNICQECGMIQGRKKIVADTVLHIATPFEASLARVGNNNEKSL